VSEVGVKVGDSVGNEVGFTDFGSNTTKFGFLFLLNRKLVLMTVDKLVNITKIIIIMIKIL
jgi:hypothetical protein